MSLALVVINYLMNPNIFRHIYISSEKNREWIRMTPSKPHKSPLDKSFISSSHDFTPPPFSTSANDEPNQLSRILISSLGTNPTRDTSLQQKTTCLGRIIRSTELLSDLKSNMKNGYLT